MRDVRKVVAGFRIGIPSNRGARLPWIDAARGFALLAMAAFHFTWDLAAFNWIDATIVDSRAFHLFGHAIAASFLFLSGYSLALARRARGNLWRDPRHWRRWGQVVAAAGAVTLASYRLFPEAPIFFGILHCIALSGLIALALVEAPAAAIFSAAALALFAPSLFAAPVFDAKVLWWTGLSTFQPASNDYRPLLPWLGFMLLGMGAANLRGRVLASAIAPPHGLAPRLPPSPRHGGERQPRRAFARLAVLGRHSLAFYLLHQPILYGALALVGPQTAPMDEAVFLSQCAAQCIGSGADAARCEASCACFLHRAQVSGQWRALARGELTESEKSAARDAAAACYSATAR